MITNNIYSVLFLIITLIASINLLPYNLIALGSADNDDNDDEDNNHDMKEKGGNEKDDGDDDNVPFILPVPFP